LSRANPSRGGDAKPGVSGDGDGPAAEDCGRGNWEREVNVKAILARFTIAVALLACMALTVGAGIRWS
jgi:hypothetical protein